MNRIRKIAATVAGLAGAGLALAAAAPSAFAAPAVTKADPGGGGTIAPAAVAVTRTVVVSGMTGWQIALIAVGSALLAGVIAVLADRARTARRALSPRAV
jgi:hypothetical protein